jgi:hypothetical protein
MRQQVTLEKQLGLGCLLYQIVNNKSSDRFQVVESTLPLRSLRMRFFTYFT